MTESYSYLIHRVPKPGRTSFIKKLQQISYEKISDGFYLIADSRIDQMSVSSEKDFLIILKKVRSLIKPLIDDLNRHCQLGCLTVVAYSNLPKDPKVRKKLQRLLLRAPCFRLRKGIYAFPQLKSPGYQKFEKILSPAGLANSVKKLGGKISVVSRLNIVDNQSSSRLIQEFRERILKRMYKLSERCKTITSQIRLNDYSVARLTREVSEIKNNIVSLRHVLFFILKIFNLDFRKEYRKAVNSYMRFRRMVNEVLLPPLLA